MVNHAILLNKRHTNKRHIKSMVQTYVQLAYGKDSEPISLTECPPSNEQRISVLIATSL